MWEVEVVSRKTRPGGISLSLNLSWTTSDPPLLWEGVKLVLPNSPNARAARLNAFRNQMEKTRDALLAAPAPEAVDQVIEDSLNA
jgi:hypothetical protein